MRMRKMRKKEMKLGSVLCRILCECDGKSAVGVGISEIEALLYPLLLVWVWMVRVMMKAAGQGTSDI